MSDGKTPAPRRVWVLGPPGSGKSTLGRDFARHLAVPLVELDGLFWLPEWQVRPEDIFLDLVKDALAGRGWVADGNYSAAVGGFLSHADCIVWLDPPLWKTWPRLVRRTLGRLLSSEPICGGNRETISSVFGPTSILWYAVKAHRRQRHETSSLIGSLRSDTCLVYRCADADLSELPQRVVRDLRTLQADVEGSEAW